MIHSAQANVSSSTRGLDEFEIEGFYCFLTESGDVELRNSNGDYTGSLTVPPTITYNGETYTVVSAILSGDMASISLPSTLKTLSVSYCDNITTLEIPSSVTKVTNLSSNNSLEEVIMHPGILEIGSMSSNPKLKTLDMPNTVLEWGGCPDCTSLESIRLSDSLTRIIRLSFANCPLLKEIVIPNSVEEIREWAMTGCTGLQSITFGTNLNTVHSNSFVMEGEIIPVEKVYVNCINVPRDLTLSFPLIEEIYLGNTVKTVELGAFSFKNLKVLDFGTSVEEIGIMAFEHCTGLEILTFPSSIKLIDENAFYDWPDLKSLYLPESVETLGSWAFMGSEDLESVTVASAIPPAAVEDTFSEESYQKATLYVPETAIETYKSTYPWSLFFKIMPDNDSGVEVIMKPTAEEVVYDLQGRRVGMYGTMREILPKGVYVVGGKKVIFK